MKTKKSLLLALLLGLSTSIQVFAQEKKEDPTHKIEVLHVSPDDPLVKALNDKKEPCDEEATPPVLNPEMNNNVIDLAKHLVKDTGSILLAPIGWKKEEWIKAMTILAGITMVTTFDKDVADFSQSIRSSDTEKVSWGLEKLGNGSSMLMLLGGTYGASLLIKDQKLKVTTLTAVEGLAVAAVLTTIGKHAFHRNRPYQANSQYEFSGPGLKGGVSFPSGHTGTIFAVATVFAESYKDTKIVPIVAYSVATLAGLSRIHDNKHWLSDVVGGAVLGYAAGKFVSNRRLGNPLGEEKIKISPTFSLGPQKSMEISMTIPLGGKKKAKEQEKLKQMQLN